MSSLCNALTGISPKQPVSTDGFLDAQTKSNFNNAFNAIQFNSMAVFI